jgi:hypothetical protein
MELDALSPHPGALHKVVHGQRQDSLKRCRETGGLTVFHTFHSGSITLLQLVLVLLAGVGQVLQENLYSCKGD